MPTVTARRTQPLNAPTFHGWIIGGSARNKPAIFVPTDVRYDPYNEASCWISPPNPGIRSSSIVSISCWELWF